MHWQLRFQGLLISGKRNDPGQRGEYWCLCFLWLHISEKRNNSVKNLAARVLTERKK